jgi:hypothetical protein
VEAQAPGGQEGRDLISGSKARAISRGSHSVEGCPAVVGETNAFRLLAVSGEGRPFDIGCCICWQ